MAIQPSAKMELQSDKYSLPQGPALQCGFGGDLINPVSLRIFNRNGSVADMEELAVFKYFLK